MNQKVISTIILIITIFTICSKAQETVKKEWRLNIEFENMGTLAFNDRWYITSEGFHVHPASELYNPV